MLKFIKKIFKKSEEEVDTEPISADDWIKEYSEKLKDEISEKLLDLKDQINSEAKAAIEKADGLLKEELMNKNIPHKIHSIVESHRTNYVNRIRRFIDNITIDEIDDINNLSELPEKFSKEFENFTESNKKAYFVLKDFFYDPLLEIVKSLKALENFYNDLSTCVDNDKISEFEDKKVKIKEYKNNTARIKSLKEELKRTKGDEEKLKEKIEKFQKEKDSLQLSPEYKGFKTLYEDKARIEHKTKKKKEILLNSFSSLVSPLKKFKRISLHERLIDKYLEDPIGAVINDVAFEFNKVLKSLETSINEGKVEIKDKKKKKILSSIEMLLKNDFLKNYVYEYKDLQKAKHEKDEKLNKNKIMMDIGEVDYKLEHAQGKEEQTSRKIEEIQDNIKSLEQTAVRKDLEKDLEEFAKRKVLLI